jgi:exopolyphosphatase / guanosine-5'-triphosphate,3'-diphosphate pyrophosphatase
MKRIAVIDIGSNSLRLVLFEIDPSGYYKVIDDLKESVRLGADMKDGVLLSEERMIKAVNTLKSFKTFCDEVNADEIITVATEAVRKSENKDYFIEMVRQKTALEVRVLSGYEEAYYDSIGVINSMYVDNALVIDMGGSSTELVWIQNNQMKEYATLPIGAVNLTQRFNLEDIIYPNMEEELKDFLKNTYTSVPWLFNVHFNEVIGIGGTVRNIGKIDRKNKRYSLDVHHNYELTAEDVHSIYNSVRSKNLKQRRKIDGLSMDRADIFAAPVCAINTLLELLKVNTFIVSGKGLREGLLYNYILQHYGPIDDMLDFSIRNVLLRHNVDREHAQNVYKLTNMLFQQLQPLHHLDETFNNIVKTAAMLHDCGMSIRYYDHHKHSFYIILNSEINGLSHKKLIMSAYAASAHRSNDFDVNVFQFHSIISKLDLINVEKIGALLRISESLDKSMSGLVENIECTINTDSVTLKVYSKADITLEIEETKKAVSYFYDVYDKELLIEKL